MLRPIRNNIIISPLFDPDTTPGGLIIPDAAKSRSDQGIVKYVGPDCKSVAVGDYVLFGAYDGTTVQLEGEGWLIIMAETIIKCIIHDAITDVAGLYFKDREGNFFEAPYEVIIDLVRQEGQRFSEAYRVTSKEGKNWKDQHREDSKVNING